MSVEDNGHGVDRMLSVDPLTNNPSLSPVIAMRSRGHSRSSSLPTVGSPVKTPPPIHKSVANTTVYGPHLCTYLSPIVLRKELERHLKQEKEILSPKFMENSKDLFWNMVCVCVRMYIRARVCVCVCVHVCEWTNTYIILYYFSPV